MYSALGIFAKKKEIKVLFVTDSNSYSETCLFFFTKYKKEIKLEPQKFTCSSELRSENGMQ